MNLNNIRTDYKRSKIDFKNLEKNPIIFFIKWFEDALKLNKKEANYISFSKENCDAPNHVSTPIAISIPEIIKTVFLCSKDIFFFKFSKPNAVK